MLIYQLVILGLLLVPLAVGLGNFRTFARIRSGELPSLMPKVSILIPARNEERSILECVSSLLHQTYPNLEVIVLDDNSEDSTADILDRVHERRPDLNVIKGSPLPAGWTGKNWACHQLGLSASGDMLVFTDADTVHRPDSIASLVAFSERTGAHFFSGVPLQRMVTFWEQVIIPMTQFLYFAYLPNRWITSKRNPKFSAANGQLLCMTREAYDRIGGHEAVRGNLVEDVALGRLAKEHGLRSALATAIETVECRMYRSGAEVFAGFSKNLFPGLGYSVPLLTGFVLTTLAMYVAPVGFVAAFSAGAGTTVTFLWLPLAQLGVGMSVRGLTAATFRLGNAQAALHPLSALAAAVIGFNSARLCFSRSGPEWKGRSYASSPKRPA